MNFYKYYLMEEQDNVNKVFDSMNSDYRSTLEARKEGMKEAHYNYKTRRCDTDTYCNSVGRSYEEVLRLGL